MSGQLPLSREQSVFFLLDFIYACEVKTQSKGVFVCACVWVLVCVCIRDRERESKSAAVFYKGASQNFRKVILLKINS